MFRPMDRIDTDILIVGGGAAGLAATALFAAEGFDVTCVDAAPPVTDAAAPGADLRTTALMTPSVEALTRAGAWAHLAPHAAPLATMRLVDAGGPDPVPAPRETADFTAAEMQPEPFGWNLPNTALRAGLLARLAELPRARLRAPATLAALTLRETEAIARLDGPTPAQVRAKLVVAADGRESAARTLAGLTARRWSYAQKALVFAVAHPEPHGGVSTEIHRSGGPFTLVPLPDAADGAHRSSVVWMETGPKAAALAALARDDAEGFAEALNLRGCGALGGLALASPVAIWPIIAQLAPRLDGPRTALIAEAAHVVPPIGAQGLNMSVADAATLARIAGEAWRAGEDPGGAAALARYHRARWPEMAARVAGIDALNRAAMAESQLLRDLRRMGLRAAYQATPVRRAAMRLGMGAKA